MARANDSMPDSAPATDHQSVSDSEESTDVHWPEPSPLSGWWDRIMGPAA